MRAAGFLNNSDGSPQYNGYRGHYWSNLSGSDQARWYITFNSILCHVAGNDKALGHPMRCISDDEIIGSVYYDDSGIFIDESSNPPQRPYKCKLSAVSTFGDETPLSNYHRTIHLTINQGPYGWNLIWRPYEGIPFNTYFIFNGAYADSLNFFDSISGSFTSYSDINPPLGPIYYAIEIIDNYGFNPAIRDGGYDRSRSNLMYNGFVGINEKTDHGIKIF